MENKENRSLNLISSLSRSSSINSFHSIEKPGSPTSPTISRSKNRPVLISREEDEEKSTQGNALVNGDFEFLKNVTLVLSGERNIGFLLMRGQELKANLEVRVKISTVENSNQVVILKEAIEKFPGFFQQVEEEDLVDYETIFFHLIKIYEAIIGRKNSTLFHFAASKHDFKLLLLVEKYCRQHRQFNESTITELVNQKNLFSSTPLHTACLSTANFRHDPTNFSWDIINKLVALGADKEVTDKSGRNFQILVEGKMGLNFFDDYKQQSSPASVEMTSEVQTLLEC